MKERTKTYLRGTLLIGGAATWITLMWVGLYRSLPDLDTNRSVPGTSIPSSTNQVGHSRSPIWQGVDPLYDVRRQLDPLDDLKKRTDPLYDLKRNP